MCGIAFFSSTQSQKIPNLLESFNKIKYRGPDKSTTLFLDSGELLGFHRLSIMDLSDSGQQPFEKNQEYLICNGEIYNFKDLQKKVDHKFVSESDCEFLLPFIQQYGVEKLLEEIDGEFSFVKYNPKSKSIIAARDPMGVRPLFYGKAKIDGSIAFASEAKVLMDICDDITPFPPGFCFQDGEFKKFHEYEKNISYTEDQIEDRIHDLLVAGIQKRLCSDAPVGFMLSGGLDSSLVCAVAAKHSDKPITTFAIGIDVNPIDLKYAKVAADYLKTDHHEVIFTKDQTLSHLDNLIYRLETWDITTIRASLGMSLLSEYIKKNTNIKVVLTGEVSDEIFGYKYTDFAPSGDEFQKEARKRAKELYLYDVLRADRCISSNSLEARVPFSDKDFVDFVMSIDPKYKMNTTGVGKHLLRRSFDRNNYLPQSILYRDKAAFSDAVGHSMVDWLIEYAESKYTDTEFEEKRKQYTHGMPFTKESLFYREVFEKYYPNQSHLIPSFWMPNKEWENCDVQDPSARVLPNYGDSGN